MTPRLPTRCRQTKPGRRVIRGTVLLGAVTLSLVGCKSSKSDGGGLMRGIGLGGGSGNRLTSRGDPLLGGARIPPQNLPIPNRGETAQNRDPLLSPGRATGSNGKTERTDRGNEPDKDQAAAPRYDDPYRPGRSQTAAALAGRFLPTDDTLAIGDRNPTITPASGTDGSSPSPFRLPGGGRFIEGLGAGEVSTELKKLNATIESTERTATGTVVRVTVPIGQPGRDGRPGLIRQYEGVGSTPIAAAADALNQIRSDIGSR